MRQRLSPITALLCGLAALVVSLAFGSERFIREVVLERRFDGEPAVWTQVLATPNWSRFAETPGAGAFYRYGFVLVFPLVVAALVLALTRGANGFVSGWTAAVAAGAVAGFVRGLAFDDRFGSFAPGGGSRSATAFELAGQGAAYGLLTGWGIGVIAMLGGLLSHRSSGAPSQGSGGERRGPLAPDWAPPPPPPGQDAFTPPSPENHRGDGPPDAPRADPADFRRRQDLVPPDQVGDTPPERR